MYHPVTLLSQMSQSPDQEIQQSTVMSGVCKANMSEKRNMYIRVLTLQMEHE